MAFLFLMMVVVMLMAAVFMVVLMAFALMFMLVLVVMVVLMALTFLVIMMFMFHIRLFYFCKGTETSMQLSCNVYAVEANLLLLRCLRDSLGKLVFPRNHVNGWITTC